MKLVLGYLYPSVMSQYGDLGNVVTVIKRCRWRGIDVDVEELEVGDKVEADRIDLFVQRERWARHQWRMAARQASPARRTCSRAAAAS